MRMTKFVAVTAVIAAAAVTAPLAARSLGQMSTGASADPTTDTAALSAALSHELSTLPASATAEDMEASIVFVLSQARYQPSTISAALVSLTNSPDLSGTLKSAVANVRLALLARRLNRGTAALANNGGGGGFGYSSFSSPIISIGGGGSSNYSQ